MPLIAFPLRLKGGYLRLCEEQEAIASLVAIMARTPHGSWAACPNFGLRDFFEEARARPELPQLALQAVNLALQDLGVNRYRVAAITKEAQVDSGTDSYSMILASTLEGAGEHSLRFRL